MDNLLESLRTTETRERRLLPLFRTWIWTAANSKSIEIEGKIYQSVKGNSPVPPLVASMGFGYT
jgi:hypothetical protein